MTIRMGGEPAGKEWRMAPAKQLRPMPHAELRVGFHERG
jgi:hypothetical protein